MPLTPQNTVAWHDRTPAQHKALLDTWAAKGFRTLSLSLYGTVAAPRYAAVLVKRPKVIATKQFGPLNQAGIQKAFDDMVKLGYGPYILTATGASGSALFAGVWTPMKVIPLTRLNLTAKQLADENEQQKAAGRILVWADAFGTPSNTRYTAIWGPNPSKQAWDCDALDEGGAALQARFEALRATGCRPAHVSVTPSLRCLELFVDSRAGSWSSRVGMTSAGYQAAYNEATGQGRQPLRVSAAGSGAGARFAAIFASQEELEPRTFRAKGPRTVTAIDDAMEAYVKAHDLRGVGLAITRGTQLVYAKGYTLAEAAYPDVLPTTPFRQASVSKTFAAVAMYRLLQTTKDLTLDRTVQSILALKQPDGKAPKDSRFKDITLRHLLESTSGLPQGAIWWGEDAAKAFGKKLPATHEQVLRYATTFDLSGAPGSMTNVVYGNFDYLLLSAVVAKLAGASTFEQALSALVLSKLKLTRTRGSRSLAGAQAADEARHHLRVHNPENGWPLKMLELGKSVKAADRPTVAAQYGAWDYELFDGCGGLSSAVVDVARLAAMFSARSGNPVLTASSIDALFANAKAATDTLSGPDAHGYHGFDWAAIDDAANHVYRASKGGWLPGQGSVVTFSTGGFGFVIAQNGNGRKGVTTKWFDPVSAAAAAHSWPAKDLFPDYGMPSLTPLRVSVALTAAAVKKLQPGRAEALTAASFARPRRRLVLPRR
jgi:CubicO group peptidase (beta-lactamase class C family)